MTVNKIEQEQITIRLPKPDLAKAEELERRLSPLVSTRADLLRLALHLGLEVVEQRAVAYETALKGKDTR